MLKYCFFICSLLLFCACKTSSLTFQAKLADKLDKDTLFANQFTGVSIYDMQKKEYIVNYNDRKYFIPASTTKLFTFYAGLKILGSSPDTRIPALRYTITSDSLVFFGTGDPTFLHPYFKENSIYEFLKNRTEKLYFSTTNWKDNRFGMGWSWDDFNDDYSVEKSPFPLYGNFIRFSLSNKNLVITPKYIGFSYVEDKTLGEGLFVKRNEFENIFTYTTERANRYFSQDVPFLVSEELIARMLSDTLKRQVNRTDKRYKKENLKILYGLPADTMYRRMLQTSDNFLAEQILTLCASQVFDSQLNTSKIIDYTIKNYLSDLTDKPRWVDGSGLSRMNLFTPRSQVELLLKIYKEVAKDSVGRMRLFGLLAAGNRPNTTLSGLYKKHNTFIFGKTGTLSNNVNLSGYLVAKSGKMLCFSFMNNHHLQPVGQIRKRMEEILTDLYLNY
jgi:D-alanyl-D-alanine carboxypeptidase/D-alanyl-D-alanine-endopeptidase (penicillin-binding protein 4)